MSNEEYIYTDEIYGRSFYATVTDEEITNYFLHNGSLIISTYHRGSTMTTEKIEAIPRSLS